MRSRIDRHDEAYALAVIDIDHFKLINDSLGHLAGDRALTAVGQAITNAVRPADGVYRFGGDEFVAILRVDDRGEAVAAVERIVRAVRAVAPIDPDTNERGDVTVSVGAVIVRRRDLLTADDAWFARADRALYLAKLQGRDRAIVAEDGRRRQRYRPAEARARHRDGRERHVTAASPG